MEPLKTASLPFIPPVLKNRHNPTVYSHLTLPELKLDWYIFSYDSQNRKFLGIKKNFFAQVDAFHMDELCHFRCAKEEATVRLNRHFEPVTLNDLERTKGFIVVNRETLLSYL